METEVDSLRWWANVGRVPRLMETLERASKTVKFSLPLRGLQFKHELREHRDFLVA